MDVVKDIIPTISDPDSEPFPEVNNWLMCTISFCCCFFQFIIISYILRRNEYILYYSFIYS